MIKNWTYQIGVMLILFLGSAILSGCSNTKRAAKGKPLKGRSAGAILKRYEPNVFQFDWLGMKMSAEVFDGENNQGFKANVRMRKDSIIWISISPALGVEVFRVLITPDSIKYVSKVPGDKHYYLGSLEVISDIAEADMSFQMIQDILVGNAIDLEKDEEKYKSRIDDQQYVLISKVNRRLKKVVGGNEKELFPDDSLSVDAEQKKYERLKRKSDDDELLLKRYWINGYTYNLEKTIVDDFYYQRSITIEHQDFKEYQEQSYPQSTRLSIRTLDKLQEFEFKISRLKTNKPYDFPFEIPKDFERKYGL
jgi:hypothetical protein